MSKIPPLRCLFCNHRNLASARYCNECAAELHLQPCNQCGAIDNRTASTCYKCGAQFNVPAAPKRAPATSKRAPAVSKRAPATSKRAPAASKRAPAAPKFAPVPAVPELAAVPAAPVPESVPAPPILEHQIAKPTLNAGGFAIERAFLSKSPAQVVGMIRQGLRREVAETQGQEAGVADRESTHVNSDPSHSAEEPQPMDETVAPESVQYPVLALSAVEPQSRDETVGSERAIAATASRRARRLAFLTLLFAATAVSGYYYYDRSAQQLAQGRSAGQPAPDGPISVGATTATVATQVDATSAPKDTASQPTTAAEEVEKPSPAARVGAKPRTDLAPVPTNRPLDEPASVSRSAARPQAAGAALSARPSSVIDAGVKGRRDPPTFRECTEAVAALGFCGPIKP